MQQARGTSVESGGQITGIRWYPCMVIHCQHPLLCTDCHSTAAMWLPLLWRFYWQHRRSLSATQPCPVSSVCVSTAAKNIQEICTAEAISGGVLVKTAAAGVCAGWKVGRPGTVAGSVLMYGVQDSWHPFPQ